MQFGSMNTLEGSQIININKCDRVFVKYLAKKYGKKLGMKKIVARQFEFSSGRLE
jgi:hypothetical protein